MCIRDRGRVSRRFPGHCPRGAPRDGGGRSGDVARSCRGPGARPGLLVGAGLRPSQRGPGAPGA
eukprot:8853320-Lingulodinium_polyedra.AAC.1